jgi:hypothetical protein
MCEIITVLYKCGHSEQKEATDWDQGINYHEKEWARTAALKGLPPLVQICEFQEEYSVKVGDSVRTAGKKREQRFGWSSHQ